MSLLYVPVMAAKRGEFSALTNLPPSLKKRLIPVFELPSQKQDTKLFEKSICRTAVNAGKAWADRSAFLDISKWSPDAKTESGMHVLEYAFSQFHSNNIAINPVIGYDRWGDPAYCQALKNIRIVYRVTPCIRLDREAIQDDMLDAEYFSEHINDIMAALELDASNCYVLLDFGNVSNIPVPDLIGYTENAVNTLRSLGFSVIIIAGGSMPASINEAVDLPDAEGCIPRIEMLAWKAVFSQNKNPNIVFGDYLIRNPDAAEGIIAIHANAKIRYTIENQYFIVRGHSKVFDSLTIQHKKLAGKLVGASHYMNPTFSWGDKEMLNCCLGVKEIRDPTTMIALDSNHHITAVITEVFEHQCTVIPTLGAIPLSAS